MKSILIILKNLKNILPYFLLIAIYFFFVNLEARNEKDNVKKTGNEVTKTNTKSSINEEELRIKIPIIPYSQ